MEADRITTSAAGQRFGALRYQTGFGNEFATEAPTGALPEGRNSPPLQKNHADCRQGPRKHFNPARS